MESGTESMLNEARKAVEQREYDRSVGLYEKYLASAPSDEAARRELKAVELHREKLKGQKESRYKRLLFLVIFIALLVLLLIRFL